MNNTIVAYVDSCMKTQKQFMDTWMKSQKEGVERWTEATKKMQEPLLSMGGAQEGPMKDMFGFYNNCLTTVMHSVKSLADESGKFQESWKSAVEKQMEMGRDMMCRMAATAQPVGAHKK